MSKPEISVHYTKQRLVQLPTTYSLNIFSKRESKITDYLKRQSALGQEKCNSLLHFYHPIFYLTQEERTKFKWLRCLGQIEEQKHNQVTLFNVSRIQHLSRPPSKLLGNREFQVLWTICLLTHTYIALSLKRQGFYLYCYFIYATEKKI